MEHLPVKVPAAPLSSNRLSTESAVREFLTQALSRTEGKQGDPAAALLPWFCDRLPSMHSRQAYGHDLSAFLRTMQEQGIDPLQVTGDHVRMYKAALLAAGQSATTIARVLSVLRGAYQQFGTHGLLPWERVQDIQAVEAPRVEKNTTPALSEVEAKKLLHAPDRSTLSGIRDHAMLFVFFKTAARCSAVASACVGNIERTDTDYYLTIREKGNKHPRKALLEAAPAVLEYLDAAGIRDDIEGPLFRPLNKDRQTLARKHLGRAAIWKIVKRHAYLAGIDVDRLGGRGVAVHSLRKTALTNALEHGAKIEQVQQLAGHSDIRTTQLYYQPRDSDSENAARHIQIR